MSYRLKIDIQSYWHPGTGLGHGSHVDASTHRTANGLPGLPGRTLKGILRDAVTRWEQFELAEAEEYTETVNSVMLAERLFGPDADAEEKWPGLLRINDAELADDVQYYLLNKANKQLLPGLYRTLHATAIDQQSGTARHDSLRGMEVVVPLTLYAGVEEIPGRRLANDRLSSDWVDTLRASLSLIQAVGAHRTRGLGRAEVTLEVLS